MSDQREQKQSEGQVRVLLWIRGRIYARLRGLSRVLLLVSFALTTGAQHPNSLKWFFSFACFFLLAEIVFGFLIGRSFDRLELLGASHDQLVDMHDVPSEARIIRGADIAGSLLALSERIAFVGIGVCIALDAARANPAKYLQGESELWQPIAVFAAVLALRAVMSWRLLRRLRWKKRWDSGLPCYFQRRGVRS